MGQTSGCKSGTSVKHKTASLRQRMTSYKIHKCKSAFKVKVKVNIDLYSASS